MSPTESGTYKSGESYREWNQFEAALRRSLKFYSEEKIANNILCEDVDGTKKAELISHRHEIHTESA